MMITLIEWTSDNINGSALTPVISGGSWIEYTVTSIFAAIATDANRLLFAPSGFTYNSAQGVGKIYPGSNGSARRGGYFGDQAGAGIFSADIISNAESASSGSGFRCVYSP